MLGLDSEIRYPLEASGFVFLLRVGLAFQTLEDSEDVLFLLVTHIIDVVDPVVILLGLILWASVKPRVVLGRQWQEGLELLVDRGQIVWEIQTSTTMFKSWVGLFQL